MSSIDLSEGPARAGTRLLPVAAAVTLAVLAGFAVFSGGPLGPLALLPFVLPIAVWVSWSDMKFMKIPNKAVYALVAVFALAGPVALPFELWAWGWLHLAVVLVIGFLLSMARMIGAGDAKFAAAMAPFVAAADAGRFMVMFSVVVLVAVALHRGARRIPALRRALPDWDSWERKDFPMGIALAGALVTYLVLAGLGISSIRM